MKSDFVWLDGELVPFSEAKVHILTPTLHYGAGVFEGIRSYQTPDGPAVFRLSDHLQRFLDSIHVLGILEFPYSYHVIQQAVFDTMRANGFTECYIRPLMYLDGPLGLNIDLSVPKVAVAAWEWGPYLGEEAQKSGIHMMVASLSRLHPNVNMTKSKITGNYANSLLVKSIALRSGYDEAVILDTAGYVAECTGENIFLVRDGIMYTPPKALVLEGITRDTVIKLTGDLGIPVVEEMITRDQLYIADEVFITGTAAEIVPAVSVDHRKIRNGKPGEVTKALLQSYLATVRGQGVRAREWLAYMPNEYP
jgi:branched-chain amino acid aminotransferase